MLKVEMALSLVIAPAADSGWPVVVEAAQRATGGTPTGRPCTYNEMPHQCQTVSAQRREKQCHEQCHWRCCVLCSSSIFCVLLFHIAYDGLPTLIHMNVLDAHKLLPSVAQASKNLNLGRISPHQTSRSRSERRNSLLCCEGDI